MTTKKSERKAGAWFLDQEVRLTFRTLGSVVILARNGQFDGLGDGHGRLCGARSVPPPGGIDCLEVGELECRDFPS